MTKNEMETAGRLFNNPQFTDEELRLVIRGTEMCLAFLIKCEGFYLATNPLRQALERFRNARKR